MTIGIDIGGTYTKYGVVDKGQVILKHIIDTPHTNDGQAFFDTIAASVLSFLKANNMQLDTITKIGVSMPGSISSSDGMFYSANNFKFANISVKDCLSKHFNCPIKVFHDVTAASKAEMTYGSLIDTTNGVYIAIGTGLGFAVINNGKLNHNRTNVTYEYGHTTLYAKGRQCSCGRKGCVDTYVSAKGITQLAIQKGYFKTNGKHNIKVLFDDYDSNDIAKNIVNDFLDDLVEVILNITNTFRPTKLVIGGGISNGLNRHMAYIDNKLKQYNYGYDSIIKTQVLLGGLKNEASMIGATIY